MPGFLKQIDLLNSSPTLATSRKRVPHGSVTTLIALSVMLSVIGFVEKADASYEDAVMAYAEKNYAQARKLLLPIADSGDAKALFGLGLLYSKGLGVSQDYVIAGMLFTLAANRGSLRGQQYFEITSARLSDAERAEVTSLVENWEEGSLAETLGSQFPSMVFTLPESDVRFVQEPEFPKDPFAMHTAAKLDLPKSDSYLKYIPGPNPAHISLAPVMTAPAAPGPDYGDFPALKDLGTNGLGYMELRELTTIDSIMSALKVNAAEVCPEVSTFNSLFVCGKDEDREKMPAFSGWSKMTSENSCTAQSLSKIEQGKMILTVALDAGSDGECTVDQIISLATQENQDGNGEMVEIFRFGDSTVKVTFTQGSNLYGNLHGNYTTFNEFRYGNDGSRECMTKKKKAGEKGETSERTLCFDAAGFVKEEEMKINGKMSGDSKFYRNGKLVHTISMRNDEPNGLQASYNSDGNIASWSYCKDGFKYGLGLQVDYESDSQGGIYEYFYHDYGAQGCVSGQDWRNTDYVYWQLGATGKTMIYSYDDMEKIVKGNSTSNMLVSAVLREGLAATVKLFSPKDMKLQEILFHKDGGVHQVKNFQCTDEGKCVQQGWFMSLENGYVASLGHSKDGKIHGVLTWYFTKDENHNLRNAITWVEGKKKGRYVQYSVSSEKATDIIK